jgi:predicted  nucleic acid-binding Zn-ribbon protein
MLSIDYGKMDQVAAFASFLDVLSNPAEFQKMVQDYKEATAKMQEVVEAKAKIDEVDKYVSEEMAKLNEREAAIELKESEHQQRQEQAVLDLQTVADKTFALNREAQKAATEAADLRDQLNAERAAFAKEKSEFEQDKASLARVMADLTAEREELGRKAEQLKAVLG